MYLTHPMPWLYEVKECIFHSLHIYSSQVACYLPPVICILYLSILPCSMMPILLLCVYADNTQVRQKLKQQYSKYDFAKDNEQLQEILQAAEEKRRESS